MCKYAIKHKRGLDNWIECKKDGSVCTYIRWCPTKQEVVNTEKHIECKKLKEDADK